MAVLLFPYVNWTFASVLAALIDIFILALVFYYFLILIRGTRAVQLLRGIVVLLIFSAFSDLLGLRAISWLFENFWAALFVAIAVIFQPELRRALEQIGRGHFFFTPASELHASDIAHIIDEITGALVSCSKTKLGALIIIERTTGLNDYIETGVMLDATISEEFLANIFVANTPLHDGAVIIRGNRVAAAACFLPLSDNPYISTSLGTRHRAAIGISEVSDAISLAVSEENGTISMARDGKLVRSLDEKQLREMLSAALSPSLNAKSFWRKKGGGKS